MKVRCQPGFTIARADSASGRAHRGVALPARSTGTILADLHLLAIGG